MLENGAEMNFILKETNENVLMYASRENNIEMVEYLLQKNNLNTIQGDFNFLHKDSEGLTILQRKMDCKIIKKLIRSNLIFFFY